MSTISRTTEIDAVNSMLSAVGALPVTTLSGVLGVETTMARRVLHDTLLAFQAEGWFFNTDIDYVLLPDKDGRIELPDNMINVDIEQHNSCGIGVVLRGNKLYDKENKTYIFKQPLKARIVLLLPFDDLPQSAKMLVIHMASMKFQSTIYSTDAYTNVNATEAQRLRAIFIAENIRNSDYNILDTRPNSRQGFNSVHRIMRRRR